MGCRRVIAKPCACVHQFCFCLVFVCVSCASTCPHHMSASQSACKNQQMFSVFSCVLELPSKISLVARRAAPLAKDLDVSHVLRLDAVTTPDLQCERWGAKYEAMQ